MLPKRTLCQCEAYHARRLSRVMCVVVQDPNNGCTQAGMPQGPSMGGQRILGTFTKRPSRSGASSSSFSLHAHTSHSDQAALQCSPISAASSPISHHPRVPVSAAHPFGTSTNMAKLGGAQCPGCNTSLQKAFVGNPIVFKQTTRHTSQYTKSTGKFNPSECGEALFLRDKLASTCAASFKHSLCALKLGA